MANTNSYQQYSGATMGEAVGRLRALKPSLPSTVAQDFLNDRVRQIINRQPQWSGLFKEAPLYIPPNYNAGGVSFTQNSDHVSGSSTVWPVSDVINTTIPNGVLRTGYQIVELSDMTNVTADSTLYVDGGGDPETISVIAVRPTSIIAIFNKFHNPGCTVTCSSFTGRQLRIAQTYPIYSIIAIVSNTELIIDNPWFAADQADNGYSIEKTYYTMSPDIKMLYAIIDPTQGIPPLRVNVSVMEINRCDPQRTSTGYPQMFANRGPNVNGNQQWELWPRPQSARQLMMYYFAQPPKLVSEGDLLPNFIDPSVLFLGAMADAYSTKVGPDDIYYDPKMGQIYEAKFQNALEAALLADDDKMSTRYSNDGLYYGLGGANWNQSHSIDAIFYN